MHLPLSSISNTWLAAAAYVVMVLHFLFVALVLLGGLVSLRYPRFFVVHVPAFVYAILIEAIRFPCLVTDIEKDLRYLSGLPNYQRGFLGHYVEPYVSGLGLPHFIYANMGYWTVGLNLVLYAVVITRAVRRRRKLSTELPPPVEMPNFPPSNPSGAAAAAVVSALMLTLVLPGCGGKATPVPSTRSAETETVTFPYRMLVVLAESETDLQLGEQRRMLGPGTAQLESSGVRLVEVVGDDPLRGMVKVPNSGFHVVMVEKDGSVTLRETRPVPFDQLRPYIGGEAAPTDGSPKDGSPTDGPPKSSTDTADTQTQLQTRPPRLPPKGPWRRE